MGNTNCTLWTGRNKSAQNILEDSDADSVDFTNILLQQTKEYFSGKTKEGSRNQQSNTQTYAKSK